MRERNDLLFAGWFFKVVLMLPAQFDLHLLVELNQLLLVGFQLSEEAGQSVEQLQLCTQWLAQHKHTRTYYT